jgi:hypothetical protein
MSATLPGRQKNRQSNVTSARGIHRAEHSVGNRILRLFGLSRRKAQPPQTRQSLMTVGLSRNPVPDNFVSPSCYSSKALMIANNFLL